MKKNNIVFVKDSQLCEGCVLGKQHRLSFGRRVNRAQAAGELIHTDVCGSMQEDSFQGYRYFLVFKDDYSKYRSVYFLKKSDAVDKLKQFLAEIRTVGHTVKAMLTDGEENLITVTSEQSFNKLVSITG